MDIKTPEDILGMSDEDFLKQMNEGSLEFNESTEEVKEETTEIEKLEEEVKESSTNEEDTPEPKEEIKKDIIEDKTEEKIEEKTTEEKPEEKKVEVEPEKKIESGDSKPNDLQAFYDRVMGPIKANGKTIQLRDVDEVISMIQMGANYTKKVQELHPYKKLIQMLENNELADESKLGFLIDLNNKNPEAIQKLVSDAKIDPLDFEKSKGETYKPGNHTVTDKEIALTDTIRDVKTSSNGPETLELIQKTWDQASKEVLWNNPEILRSIHEHRSLGIYQTVADEVTRLKEVGKIPLNTPFVNAYHQVGEMMHKQGALDHILGKVENSTPNKDKVVKPKLPASPVANGDKARAVQTPRSSNKPSDSMVNPLSMSDEEFLAKFKGRI